MVRPEIAEHLRVEGFADSTVHLVDYQHRLDGIRAEEELPLLAARVVRRLDDLGHGSVLRIEVRGPQAPSWKKGRRTIRNARGPRDTYG